MSDEPRDRIQDAVNQFGAAIGDAMKLGLRRGMAKQIAEEFGEGPWILHPDGSVKPVPASWQVTKRILWNERGRDIDEIVLCGVVHVEQMNERCWWIGIDVDGGGHWAGNFLGDSRGRMRFTEQDMDGFDWDRDDTHEVRRATTDSKEQE